MPSHPKSSNSAVFSQVSRVVGATNFLLPGESQDDYSAGVQSIIEELQAKTHLQVYLAEKMFQCMWWLRRYELQKQSAIREGVVGQITNYASSNAQRLALRELVHADAWQKEGLQAALTKSGHTAQSVVEAAFSKRHDELIKLDQQIALRIKTLHQLQQSYEALVNRSVIQERLKMQNELLMRELKSIEAPGARSLEPGTR